jgi:hypothetical protein
MEGQIDEMKSDREARRLAADPYALVPEGAPDKDAESELDSCGPAETSSSASGSPRS